MEASKWAIPNYTSASSKPSPTAAPFVPASQTSFPAASTDDGPDEFAQTRSPDDLFADDFTPMAEPAAEVIPTQARVQQQHTRGSRGRGPRRGGGSGGRNGPRYAPSETVPAASTSSAIPPIQIEPVSDTTAITESTTTTDVAESTDISAAPPTAPAIAPKPPTTPAVRGDRTATGGLAKPKLSETELAVRMEAIKLKNVTLTAAHERAEADEASFQAREAHAQERRRQERQNRQQMMGEREKNRARKLQAVGGREWDAEKGDLIQQGESGRGGSGFRRGAYGGVVMGGRIEPEMNGVADGDVNADIDDSAPRRGGYNNYRGQRGGDRGTPRGGRGGGRGGRGRGGFDGPPGPARNPQQQQQKPPQTVPGEEDFPALGSGPALAGLKAEKSGKGASWAEEMEDGNIGAVNA